MELCFYVKRFNLSSMRKTQEEKFYTCSKGIMKNGSIARDSYQFLTLLDFIQLISVSQITVEDLHSFYSKEESIFYNAKVRILIK